MSPLQLPTEFFPPGNTELTKREMCEFILLITAIRFHWINLHPLEIEALCTHESRKPWAREWRAIEAIERVKEHYTWQERKSS